MAEPGACPPPLEGRRGSDFFTISEEQIERIEAEVARARQASAEAAIRLRHLHWRHLGLVLWRAYLPAARWLRRGVEACFGWRPGGVLVLATAAGAVCFVATFSWAVAVMGLGVGAACTASLLYVPRDGQLAEALLEAPKELAALRAEIHAGREAEARARSDVQSLAAKLDHSRRLLAEKRRRESAEYRREQLARRNWKALRSVDFEMFLEEVFRELGYTVELTKITGDQGADLIVSKGGCRIAIQVKGYVSSVSNGAVQEALAGKVYYGCDGSAVITNSRFTPSASDLAAKAGCVLIGEDELPALIRGRIDLCQMHFEATAPRPQFPGG